MLLRQLIEQRRFMLSEGSMYERLRRDPSLRFDPELAHGALIYEPAFAARLAAVHREYLDVARRHQLPMFVLTDTWRANAERIARSGFAGRPVNQDNARFLRALCAEYAGCELLIGGQIGPQGDAYRPAEAPATAAAQAFHRPQIEALAEGGVDFLYAATLPALDEAIGMAAAMAATGLPYVLSFVLRRSGQLLDGRPLAEAIACLDALPHRPPLGYAVNCVHPNVLDAGLAALPAALLSRLLSYQANSADLDPEQLDGQRELIESDPDELAGAMLGCYRRYGLPSWGGCCGTDTRHIEALARQYRALSRGAQ